MRRLSVGLAFILFLVSLSAPSQSGTGENRPFLDLDGNGTADFLLERSDPMGHETLTTQDVWIVPKRKNQIVMRGSFLAALSQGALIGKTLSDTLKWTSEASFLYRVSYHTPPGSSYVRWNGFWPNTETGYLGLMLSKGGRAYYGWARVHVDTTKPFGAVRLRASSYNPDAGRPIRAGQQP